MGSKKSKLAAKNPQQQNAVIYPGASYYQQPQYLVPQFHQPSSLVLAQVPLPPPPPQAFGPVFPIPPHHHHHQHRRHHHKGPRVIDEPPIPLNYLNNNLHF